MAKAKSEDAPAKQKGPMTSAQVEAMINKNFPGAIKRADDPAFVIERIPTGLLALDVRLKGGLARGRHIELYGPASIGKTAITFNAIATAQEAGLNCSFIDAEGTFDPEFAASQGVDLKKLRLTQQGEDGLSNGNKIVDFMEAMLRSKTQDIIVLDSIAALIAKAEEESSMSDGSMGTEQARLMSKALRKLTAANRRTALIYINQTRQKIGAAAFAKQSITSGGQAMGYYAGTRLEIVRTENISREGERIDITSGETKKAKQVRGHRLLIRVEKDKTGSAINASETTMVYDYELGGFDYLEDLIYLGRHYRLIKKNGASWWLAAYPEDKSNGRPAFKAMLGEDEAVCDELHEAIEEAAYTKTEEVEDDEAE